MLCYFMTLIKSDKNFASTGGHKSNLIYKNFNSVSTCKKNNWILPLGNNTALQAFSNYLYNRKKSTTMQVQVCCG
jgi:hypothetical protein